MIFEHQGECPFCHAQMFIQSTKADMTAAELSEEAADLCTCPEARLSRGMKATENGIAKVLGEESINAGFTYAANEETTDAVRGICQMMLLDYILGGQHSESRAAIRCAWLRTAMRSRYAAVVSGSWRYKEDK